MQLAVANMPYAEQIHKELLAAFCDGDSSLILIADKDLSSLDAYSAVEYSNYALSLNNQIANALAERTLQTAFRKLAELSSLITRLDEVRGSEDELAGLGALPKALLCRRAADLTIAHYCKRKRLLGPISWQPRVVVLCRVALHWLATSSAAASASLVGLEALEANAIIKRLAVPPSDIHELLENEECAELLADGLAGSDGCSIGGLRPAGLAACLEGVDFSSATPSLSSDKYNKCFSALATSIDSSVVLRRLIWLMNIDPVLRYADFVDECFMDLPAFPKEFDDKSYENMCRFDIKTFLVSLLAWVGEGESARTGESFHERQGHDCVLIHPSHSSISAEQVKLWKAVVSFAFKRHASIREVETKLYKVLCSTRLSSPLLLPLLRANFDAILHNYTAETIPEIAGAPAEEYSRQIIRNIQGRSERVREWSIFPAHSRGMGLFVDDENELLEQASLFLASRHMKKKEWAESARNLASCSVECAQANKLRKQLYTTWLASSLSDSDRNFIQAALVEVEEHFAKETEVTIESPKRGTGAVKVKFYTPPSGTKTRSPTLRIEGSPSSESNESFITAFASPHTNLRNGESGKVKEVERMNEEEESEEENELYAREEVKTPVPSPRKVEMREQEVQTVDEEKKEKLHMPESAKVSPLLQNGRLLNSSDSTACDWESEEASMQLESVSDVIKIIQEEQKRFMDRVAQEETRSREESAKSEQQARLPEADLLYKYIVEYLRSENEALQKKASAARVNALPLPTPPFHCSSVAESSPRPAWQSPFPASPSLLHSLTPSPPDPPSDCHPHDACWCCADDDVQDAVIAALDRLAAKYDKIPDDE